MKRRLCAFLAAALCAGCLTTAALAGDESLHTDYVEITCDGFVADALDGVEARDYDLYLIEANYGEEEIQERMARKLAAGGYAYESRCVESHLSREQAEAWLAANAKEGWSKVLFLHQHRE